METSTNNTVVSSSLKTKHAAKQIYKPPSLRSDEENLSCNIKTKLNVHAKEFFMNDVTAKNVYDCTKKNSSKEETKIKFSPVNVLESNKDITLNFLKSNSSQNSKSIYYKQIPSLVLSNTNSSKYGLQRAKSIGDVLINNKVNESNGSSKVQFKIPESDANDNQHLNKWSLGKEKRFSHVEHQISGNLKRSKSLTSADTLTFMKLNGSSVKQISIFNEYDMFPEKIQDLIRQAIQNTNRMTDTNKITLARFVVEHVLTDEKYASPVAKLSIIIIEKDKSSAYLDSLLNTCQMLYQKKEISMKKNSSEFVCFLTYLTKIYIELKRSKLQTKLLSDPIITPKITILILISRCCEDILFYSRMHSNLEIECLYLTLTNVGQDIECELPTMFKKLFTTIRDIFLKGANEPQIQKILLQLIELRAARWLLPISALNYYYPKASIKITH